MSINVTRSSMPSYEEYCEEIKELWDSHWLTNNGAKHKRLEADLKEYMKTPNITLFTNGHLALEIVIASMDLPRGGEVITTPFTFASTTHAIARNGLTPVFCDINRKDYTIDVSKIEALITDKTVAIVPVHVYGNICDIEAIDFIARKYNLKVIYDAAHAFGVKYKGESVANLGDASMFSFHATKVFNTIEGGAVTYKDSTLADKLESMKNFGLCGENGQYIAGNAKMNEFQASMGICNLRHIKEEIIKRGQAVSQYQKRLSCIDGIVLCQEQENVETNYAYFPVVFDGYKYTRDEVFERLKANDIIARKYFYPLISDFDCYKGSNNANTPVAKYVADRVLTLPLYADLTVEEVDKICDIILN